VGGNEAAAWLAGIDTRGVTLGTYVANGLLVGLAGAVLTARLGAAVPNAGLGYELDVIAAVVVGGTALTGGRGSVLGTLAGAVCIGTLDNALNLANVDPYLQRVVVGVVILLAVLGERLRHRGRT
jgi:ribose/xylose/arabinose/galactoside ABC-type transport system permease subunit